MSAYEPLDEAGRASVQRILDGLESMDEAIGGWSEKVNARQTGVTYYATFGRKVDVMTSLTWASQLAQCPAMLADACRRLLAADEAAAARLEAS